MKRERVAIVGGGIGGLTSAYLLNDLHDIKLFEKQGRIGGNAHTFKTKTNDYLDISVFAYGELGYPNFFKLLSKLGLKNEALPVKNIGMSTYNLDTHRGLLLSATLKAMFNPLQWKTALSGLIMLRIMKKAMDRFETGEFEGMAVGEVLDKLHLKGAPYLLASFPITLSSSMLFDDVLKSPASFFFGKLKHHAGDRETATSWQLLDFRTQKYIDALASNFQDKIQLNSDIKRVIRDQNGVSIEMNNGGIEQFDKVVFACNADQALALIEEPTKEEEVLLGVWRYQPGMVFVHTDDSEFPKKRHWALYDYLYTKRKGKIETSINAAYRFQHGMPDDSNYLGTQHPNYEIDPRKTEFKKEFRTPIFDQKAMDLRAKLPSLNGVKNSYFCGSHFGWGLHEDAVASAAEVGKLLGAQW